MLMWKGILTNTPGICQLFHPTSGIAQKFLGHRGLIIVHFIYARVVQQVANNAGLRFSMAMNDFGGPANLSNLTCLVGSHDEFCEIADGVEWVFELIRKRG